MRLSGKEAIPPSNEAMPPSHGFVSGTSPSTAINRARANRAKKKQALDLQGLASGGDSWTRTNDPIDVNDVLYRLSHATTRLMFRPQGTQDVVGTSNRFESRQTL